MHRLIFLSLAFIPFSFNIHAESANKESLKQRLEIIDKEINALKEELHKERLNAMENEIRGQHFMLEEWHEYAHQLQEAEKLDDRADLVEKRLEELKQQWQNIKKQIPEKKQ
jgi:hypothetical protein